MRWLFLFAAACSGSVAGDAKDGPKVYAAVCVTCHGPTGKPDPGMVARLNVKDLTAPELRAKITPALVAKQVREGSQNKLMPAFGGALTDQQIEAVASYVASPQFLERR